MSTGTTVGDICQVMDRAYPPYLAEDWDSVGLICGRREAAVNHVAFALDCTDEVAQAAISAGVDMLIVHHPLLLRGVDSVAADTPKGRILHRLIEAGIALFAAHTNADSARPGVNDKLAELVGITPGRPLAPKPGPGRHLWGVHVPAEHVDKLKQGLFAAGAGRIGNYSECVYEIVGTGQFKPEPGADPTDGEVGKTYRADELRIQFVANPSDKQALVDALLAHHPYEEPAFDITELADATPIDQAYGLGRLGQLPQPMSLAEFTQQVADGLPATSWGVRAAGDPDKQVQTVAVASGAGDGFMATAAKLGADVFVTSDLRHHPVDEHLRSSDMAIIDTAHWASEFPWTAQAEEIVRREAGVETSVLDVRTDPWTVAAHKRGE